MHALYRHMSCGQAIEIEHRLIQALTEATERK